MTTLFFDEHRPYLMRLAYRLLGSVADAEDATQETFIRWQTAGAPELVSPRAWLARTCTRLCLDVLKSSERTRVTYVGDWLPEPLFDDAADKTRIDDTLSMALLLSIQRLRPTERAVFLRPRNTPVAEEVTRIADAFFAALDSGDVGVLTAVLASDVVMRADGGGKVSAIAKPLVGASDVAAFLEAVFIRARPVFERREVWFNGAPGVLLVAGGRPISAFQFDVVDGRIEGIFVQRNPDKLEVFEDRPSLGTSRP